MKRNLLPIFFLIPFLMGSASRDFDGVDDNIDMGNVLNVTTGNFSLCGWSKLDETDTVGEEDDTIASKKAFSSNTAAGYTLRQSSSDKLTFRVSDGTEEVVSASTTDIDGAWYWSCGTWTSSSEVTVLYINGVQEDTDTGGGAVDSLSNAVAFEIGDVAGVATETANGLLAYIFQTSNVLTLTEVKELMWKPGIFSGNGLFPLWGDSTEIDLSGNGLVGTVSGTTTSTDGPPVMWGGGLPL